MDCLIDHKFLACLKMDNGSICYYFVEFPSQSSILQLHQLTLVQSISFVCFCSILVIEYIAHLIFCSQQQLLDRTFFMIIFVTDLQLYSQLEDINASLYLVKCDAVLNRAKNKQGEKQTIMTKCCNGICLFFVLICVIWAPMLVSKCSF